MLNTKPTKLTKTARLLKSFQSVVLLPEHRNNGDQERALRDYGFAPSIATALIRWGETESLVCTFENQRGVSDGAYSWKQVFVEAAVAKHVEMFGELGWSDLPLDAQALVPEHLRPDPKYIQPSERTC